MKPWSGENAAKRISRPLRHNGMPYSGINILMLWGASVEQGFTSPSWMTFRQAPSNESTSMQGMWLSTRIIHD